MTRGNATVQGVENSPFFFRSNIPAAVPLSGVVAFFSGASADFLDPRGGRLPRGDDCEGLMLLTGLATGDKSPAASFVGKSPPPLSCFESSLDAVGDCFTGEADEEGRTSGGAFLLSFLLKRGNKSKIWASVGGASLRRWLVEKLPNAQRRCTYSVKVPSRTPLLLF
jgi:hypothetical protein